MRGTEVSLYFDSFEVCTLYYRPPEVSACLVHDSIAVAGSHAF